MALAKDLKIEGEDECGASCGLRTVDQPGDEVAVAHDVELKPERLVAVLRDVFN